MEQEEKKYTLKELQEKLTEKERILCHEWIIDWNGARAARAAGYSEDSAKQIASENLTKPYLKQYIEFIRNDHEKESGISKLRNLNELSKIAYTSVEYIHNDWIELKDWEKIKIDNPNILSAIESIDSKTETKSYNGDVDVEIKYVKVKFFSKLQAIQIINDMQGYKAASKLDLSNTDGTLNIISLGQGKKPTE